MSSQIEEMRAHFVRMQELIEWGKQSREHGMVSMSFRAEALMKVAKASFEEHSSYSEEHFDRNKENRDGCAVCFYLYEMVK